jgi:hypothetical protein
MATTTSYQTRLTSIHCPKANTCYAVGDSSRDGSTYVKSMILKTSNGGTTWGTTWARQYSGLRPGLNSVYCTDTSTCYVAGDTGIVLKTVNGGTTWASSNTGVPKANAWMGSIFFTSANTGYMAGSGGTSNQAVIMKTVNGGGSWSSYSPLSASNPGLYSIHFPKADTGYAVGDALSGQVATVLKGIGPPVNIFSPQVSGGAFCFGKNGDLRYQLLNRSRVQTLLFNSQGRMMLKLLDAAQDAGFYNLSFPAGRLARGAYLLDFHAGEIHRAIPVGVP